MITGLNLLNIEPVPDKEPSSEDDPNDPRRSSDEDDQEDDPKKEITAITDETILSLIEQDPIVREKSTLCKL